MIFIILTILYFIIMGVVLYFLIDNFKRNGKMFEFILIMVEAGAVSFIYFVLSYISFVY